MKSIFEIQGKKILFAATKNSDYLRITQELRILREQGNQVTVLCSAKKSYPKRLLAVYRGLLRADLSQYDMSFIGFAPQLILPLFGRKLRKKPIVLDFFISLYDTLCFDRKKFSPKSPVGRLLRRLDRNTLRQAELVLCDTKAHGRYFSEEFDCPPERLSVLYLEADSSIYYPRQVPPQPRFTVFYFGSILPLQGVPVILDAIDLLKDRQDLHFVLVGPLGKDLAPKGEAITEYIDWLPQEQLAQRIAEADLCLAGHFDPDIAKASRTIPGKAYIYHAMKKPMILGDNAANHELFDESEEGIYFTEMGNPRKLAEQIVSIATRKGRSE